MKIIRLLILLLSISISYISFSKEIDFFYNQADSSIVKYFSNNFNDLTLGNVVLYDTSALLTPFYDKLNSPFYLYQTLSNSGVAHKHINYKSTQNAVFNSQNTSFSSYIHDVDKIQYPLTLLPFTNICYVSGENKDQHFDILFSREFLPRFFLTISYDVDHFPGVYKRSVAHNTFFNTNLRYNTKNERYGINACYFNDKVDVQENGGIVYDSVFINKLESDKSIIDVNLIGASNLLKTSGFAINQYFNILSPDAEFDQDSIQQKYNVEPGRINYHLSYNRQSVIYEDSNPTSSFYQSFDPVINKAQTFDSIYFHSVKNTIYWNNLGYKKYNNDIPFYLTLGLEHNYIHHAGYVDLLTQERFNDHNYSNFRVNAGILFNVFKSTNVGAHSQIITTGYHAGDFYIDAYCKQFLGTFKKNIGSLNFDVDISKQSADWFEDFYYSNNFRWDNDFSPELYIQFKGSYQLPCFEVGIKQTNISNYIYFGTDAKPKQYSGHISVSSFYSTFNLKLNKFEMIGYASFQTTNNDNVIHLPDFQGKVKFAYNIDLVKNISMMQPSIVISYFTEYYADAYMPALRTFYLQDEIKVGNYPYIDLCVTFKIKNADIFAQYTNLYSLTGDNRYFTTPHYPMRDAMFCLGVKWRLYK